MSHLWQGNYFIEGKDCRVWNMIECKDFAECDFSRILWPWLSSLIWRVITLTLLMIWDNPFCHMPNFCTASGETAFMKRVFCTSHSCTIFLGTPRVGSRREAVDNSEGSQSNQWRYHVNMEYLRTRVLLATLAAILTTTIGQELECQSPNQGRDLFPMAWFKIWYLFEKINFFDGKKI